ncbi:MAG: hypothetical protein ACJ75H_22600 [Thermoanaerobaculia bacterium]
MTVRDASSERVGPLLRRDPEVAFWWGAAVECTATLLAAQRLDRLTPGDVQRARGIFDHLQARSFEVQPSDEVRARALRLVALHDLPTPAALELAAALVWRRDLAQPADFVSLHGPLRLAASLEGFRVLPYADEVHAPDPGV